VERWRFISAAMREVIVCSLVRVNDDAAVGESIKFYEIATDGIPVGPPIELDRVHLWPGYRSDVLVFAPDKPGAKYLLKDERNGIKPEDRTYLALIEIENVEPAKIDPSLILKNLQEELPSFYPTSIAPSEVTGFQLVHYGIFTTGGTRFTVDNQSFSEERKIARQLTMGNVEEWTILVHNDYSMVGKGPSHPFHIHVNPFEIVSITDVHGVDRNPWGRPVWKDTIIMHEGQKVVFRTRYEDFDGLFVQHCHILDHEDSGMMELIQIFPPPSSQPALTSIPQPHKAPGMMLTDAWGGIHCWDDRTQDNKPTVVFLFEKTKCLACSIQIQEYANLYDHFLSAGIDVFGVSSGTVEDLLNGLKKKNQMPIPVPLFVDASGKIFKDYGCTGLHGTFIIDKSGDIKWQHVSTIPYDNVKDVLEKAESFN